MSTGKTILLAEDDEQVRRLFADVLRQAGHEVIVAANGDDAMIRFAEHEGPVHLLLTDVMMPLLRGDRLARHIRRLHPGVKLLYISGYSTSQIVEHEILDPLARVVPKPVRPQELVQIVSEILDG
jgi:two-component system cell cycle sensor histidine kinase/response regulator CckA